MVYGSEAVLPTDLEYGSPRVQAYDENSGKMFQEDALDQLDEARDVPSYTPPSTSRPSADTMRDGSEAEPFKSATWC